MLVISSRKDFYDSRGLASTFECRDVPFPDFVPETKLTFAELKTKVRNRRTLVLVHGYRNTKAAIAPAYAKVESALKASNLLGAGKPYEALIGYLWPGGQFKVEFPFAIGWANRSGKQFRDIVNGLIEASASVDIQTHSLGARVALKALDGEGVKIRQLWMLAAAVDDEDVEKGEDFHEAAHSADRCYVLHSKNDPVLKVAYRIGDLGDFDAALGWEGPEDPEAIRIHSPSIRIVDCQDIVKSHGGYRDAPETYDYWLNELTGQPREQFVRLAKNR